MQEIHYTPGRFVWHEIVTSDVEAARRFYGELAGWQVEPKHQDGVPPYYHLTRNGHTVGGLIQRPGPHVPPHLLGYVSVLDLDGSIGLAREHRAAVLVPPMQTALGRAAVVQDPQGAVLGLCRRADGDVSGSEPAPAAGVFCLSQLRSSDADNAASFYGKVLGWQRSASRSSELSAFTHGDRSVAGLMQAPQGTFAHWLTHVSVECLDRSRAIVRQLGGTVMVEHVAQPGIGHVSIIQDNVGTILALLEADTSS